MIVVVNNKNLFVPVTRRGDLVKVSFDCNLAEVIHNEDGTTTEMCTWKEHLFANVPSINQLKRFVLDAINKDVDDAILSGFTWRDYSVWLSSENQFNYKAAYDLAIQTGGANLPVVFKFGTAKNPVYHKFDNVEDLSDFYIKAAKHINEQLAIGWAKKDSIDWSVYENALK